MSEEGSDKTAQNTARARHRKDTARAISAARETLTSSGGIRPAFDKELTLAYARNNISSALAATSIVIVIALIASFWISYLPAVVWMSMMFIGQVFHLSICRKYIDSDRKSIDLARWRRRFVTSEAVLGVLSASLVVMAPQSDQAFGMFSFATMLIIVAGGTILSSNIPSAMIARVTPITIVTGIVFALQQGLVYYATAGMAIAATSFLLVLGYRLHQSALASLEFQVEKDGLIAELEQANGISDEARRRAEEANLAKSRFLATMSHELRTPLNAILGFSEVIRNEVLGPVGNDTYKEYVGDIHDSGRHLLNLINEILDLTRIEAGRYALSEEAVSLPAIAEDCHHLIRLRASNKDLTIHANLQEDLPRVWADERALRQVILNLLSNAVKFTPKGGEITLKVGWTAGGGQYVSVRDNGPGIPEDEIPIVLSAFGQGAIAHRSAEDGTGLGLPIVQALMAMHGGGFELRSKLREGTEVIVSLPRGRVLDPMPAVENVKTSPRRRSVRG